MLNYDYQCQTCEYIQEERHGYEDTPIIKCNSCKHRCKRVILHPPGVVIPPHMSATGNKYKYYGIKNIRTGEGITKDTDVSDPPGIRVKSIKPPKTNK